jgi:hypothetical protein
MLNKLTKSKSCQRREFRERKAGLPCSVSCNTNCRDQSTDSYTIYLSGKEYFGG